MRGIPAVVFGFMLTISAFAWSQTSAWEAIVDAEGRFSVEMPAPIEASEKEFLGRKSREWVSKPDESTRLGFFVFEEKSLVGCLALYQERLSQELEREFRGPYTWLRGRGDSSSGSDVALGVDLHGKPRWAQADLIKGDGGRCYMRIATTPADAPMSVVTRFMSSLRLFK